MVFLSKRVPTSCRCSGFWLAAMRTESGSRPGGMSLSALLLLLLLLLVCRMTHVDGFDPRRCAVGPTGTLYSSARKTSMSKRSCTPKASIAKEDQQLDSDERIELWKTISRLEKDAIDLLMTHPEELPDTALDFLARSVQLKQSDKFIQLSSAYVQAIERGKQAEAQLLLAAMRAVGLPPHLQSAVDNVRPVLGISISSEASIEEVDPGSIFSDTVTDRIRVKVHSFFDTGSSVPSEGKYIFNYKVAILNEGSEPVQLLARMWETEVCSGGREVIRGTGVIDSQPVIPPGDVFTYQGVCSLQVFPPKGKRLLGSMSGSFTMCKGPMGQNIVHALVSKLNLVLPEAHMSK